MDNRELEKMIRDLKAAGAGQPSEEFMDKLKASYVVVPALIPPDTDPAIMKRLLQNPGRELAIPDGVSPQPCLLENGQGDKLLAVFTSEKEMHKNKEAPKFPITMRVAFEDCINLIRKSDEILGAVINPFTHNMVFRVEENKPVQQTHAVQITAGQFHNLTRQRMEANYLPKTLFDKKEEAVMKLRDGRGEYLRLLYEDLYNTELACPYAAEDFEVMSLNISDELLLMRISMPQLNLAERTCPCVFVGWNGKAQKVWYYAVVIEQGRNQALYEMKEDGISEKLGKAPEEGSELTAIIDLIQGAGNEKQDH